MANAWLAHVKKTMKVMKKHGTYKKGMGLKQVISAAKKTYKKHRGGEEKSDDSSSEGAADGVEVPGAGASTKPTPEMGGRRHRRRSTGRTRRHRRR